MISFIFENGYVTVIRAFQRKALWGGAKPHVNGVLFSFLKGYKNL